MWAPIRAIIPVAEFTGELRVHDRVGAVALLGGGRRTIESGTTKVTGTELEFGAQGRFYLLAPFESLHVALEVLDEYVTFDEPLPAGVAGVAAGGVTAGALVGYKLVTGVGFTFEAQLGARYLIVEPTVTGMGDPMIDGRWLPLLHLNVGWTF